MIYIYIPNRSNICEIMQLSKRLDTKYKIVFNIKDIINKTNDKIICIEEWPLKCFKKIYDNKLDIAYDLLIKYVDIEKYRELFINNNYKLLLFNCWEMCFFHGKNNIDRLIKFNNEYLKLGKTIYMTCDIYNWDYINNNEFLSIHSFDFPYIREFKTKYKTITYNNNKKKRFIYLNRKSNIERLVCFIYFKNNFNNYFYFSYLEYNISKRSINEVEKIFSSLNITISINEINNIINNLPIEIDGNINNVMWNNITDNLYNFINDSNIFIIFESLNSYKLQQQVSEKSYKAIKIGMPFILFGTNGNILKHLKNIGFKTFSPFINEEYDNCELNWFERINILFKEISRISNLSELEFNKLYNNLLVISKYNYNYLHNNFNSTILRKFENIINI